MRDSLVVLALLLEQETELEPLEIMTDTAAYSDAIFGLFWLLGYRFSPRLADIGGAKLWRIDRQATYGQFDALAWGRINIALIRENWPDLIRLAGSLKLGHLKAAGVMRMLQVKDRPTTLAKALSELGRIIKTLHILRYIDDRPFRRRILFQLNRQELRHKLGRRVHHDEAVVSARDAVVAAEAGVAGGRRDLHVVVIQHAAAPVQQGQFALAVHHRLVLDRCRQSSQRPARAERIPENFTKCKTTTPRKERGRRAGSEKMRLRVKEGPVRLIRAIGICREVLMSRIVWQ